MAEWWAATSCALRRPWSGVPHSATTACVQRSAPRTCTACRSCCRCRCTCRTSRCRRISAAGQISMPAGGRRCPMQAGAETFRTRQHPADPRQHPADPRQHPADPRQPSHAAGPPTHPRVICSLRTAPCVHTHIPGRRTDPSQPCGTQPQAHAPARHLQLAHAALVHLLQADLHPAAWKAAALKLRRRNNAASVCHHE